MSDAETIAKHFHNYYEWTAPAYGYETRKASAVPWDDVPAQNKELMIAVVNALIRDGIIASPASLRTKIEGLCVEPQTAVADILTVLDEYKKNTRHFDSRDFDPPIELKPDEEVEIPLPMRKWSSPSTEPIGYIDVGEGPPHIFEQPYSPDNDRYKIYISEGGSLNVVELYADTLKAAVEIFNNNKGAYLIYDKYDGIVLDRQKHDRIV